jgi:hypothetical protein
MLIGIAVGVWHSVVPYLFQWYSYLPGIPDILRVSIDWVNFFFSLFLTGYSVLLLLVRSSFFAGERTARLFYGFFLLVWFCRVGITIVHNWGLNAAVIGYIAAFTLEFVLLLIPFVATVARERTAVKTAAQS